MSDTPKPEFALGPVDIELAPGVAYKFDAMPLVDPDSMQLYIDWMAAMDADETLDRAKFFPRFVTEARKNLLERYTEAEADAAMKLVRISERAGSPWSQIIKVLVGLA